MLNGLDSMLKMVILFCVEAIERSWYRNAYADRQNVQKDEFKRMFEYKNNSIVDI